MFQGRTTLSNKIKSASISKIFSSFLSFFGVVLFQFPSDSFKLSKFGISCIALQILRNVHELYVTNEVDSSYYNVKSAVLYVSSIISCVFYGILVFTLSFLNFIKRKKIFEIFKRVEAMEKNVSLK